MNPELPRRPVGITLLAVILGWLALAGFANALLAPLVFGGGFAAHMFRTSPVGTATLLCILALAYGTTALIAAVGLWRMETWAARAFLAWAIAAVCVCLFFVLSASVPTPWFVSLAFVAFIALLLGAVWSHIGRQIDHHYAELLRVSVEAANRVVDEPQPIGRWSSRSDQSPFRGFFAPGRRYRVIREFRDYDRDFHAEGEEWLFLGHGYFPYENGISWFVSIDGAHELHIRMRDHEEEQGPIVARLSEYFRRV